MNTPLSNEKRLPISQIAADIARELRANPHCWTQGTFAKNAMMEPVCARSDYAVCWCLGGHIEKRVPRGEDRFSYFADFEAATKIGVIAVWNDRWDRHITDVIQLCDQVAGPGAGFAHFRSALDRLQEKP